ncbi:MAG: histidine--tRNA ligase [Nevskiales bacterium]|nr:histidine--tRNA ligase [Nevskiales bacterium]
MANKFQSLRGFNDVLPPDTAVWQRLHACARDVFTAYGYREIILPLLESTELFKRSMGETSDVVEKEMFSFQDREGDSLTLRPEFTAGMVRAGLEHGFLHHQQQRLWSAGPVFRHERPQAGRYRQFHQLNVEAYGLAGPDIDVEVIALSARLLKRLGLQGLTLELNSLGEASTRNAYRAALTAYLEKHESSLDEDSRRRLHRNPLRVLDSKVPRTQEIVRAAPQLPEYLDAESRAHFDGVQQGLSDLGIAYTVNPFIVRGLDYYTKSVFEWTTDQLGAQGTVLAGGRYDSLVEQLGGSKTPAVGWAAGVERLVLLMQALHAMPFESNPQVYFCSLGETAERQARTLAESLRDALPQLHLVLNAGGGSLKAQLGRADKSGARFALILGDAEVTRQTVLVKSLRLEDGGRESGDRGRGMETAWTELPARIAALLSSSEDHC